MTRLLACSFSLIILLPLNAEDWPGWRGPRGDGTSLDKKVPLEWDTKKNVVWAVDLPGIGHSSPIIHGDRIFVSTCLEDDGKRLLVCLNRKTGKKEWEREVLAAKLEGKHSYNSYASATPATDGKHVWVAFLAYPDAQLACYTVAGKKVWQKSPGKLLSVHGFCSSPVLHKNLVILNGDQDAKAYIVAYEKDTGKEKWRIDRPNRKRSYCTPLFIPDPKRAGKTQMVLSGSKGVTAYDADSGDLVWSIKGPTEQYVASLVYHKGILFLTTGFPEYHLMGITPDGKGDITKSKHIVWHIGHRENTARGASYVPSPLAHDGHFFVVSDPGYLSCLEVKSGKRVWMKKLGRRHSASPVLIDGHLVVPDDDGKTFVVKAGPKYELVRTNVLKESIYASPAVSRGQLFLRTTSKLYCIGKK